MFNNKRNLIAIMMCILLTLGVGVYGFAQSADKKELYNNLKMNWDKEYRALQQMSEKAKTDEEVKALRERSSNHKNQGIELGKLKQEVYPPTPQEVFEKQLKTSIVCISIDRSMDFSKEKLDQKEQKLKQLEADYKAGIKTVEESQNELDEIEKLPIKK